MNRARASVRHSTVVDDKLQQRQCELQVWSFNLRTEHAKEDDLENLWPKRRQGVADLIVKYRPSIVCVQEATAAMLTTVCQQLGGMYEWKGTSRFVDLEDEAAGFIYNTACLRLLDNSVFWLKPEALPDGKPGWDAMFPRTCETALFQILESGGQLRVFNTHFDHQGSNARRESAQLIASRIAVLMESQPSCAHVLCGDFNSPKCSEPYSVFTKFTHPSAPEKPLLKDVFRSAEVDSGGAISTIHKWQGLAFSEERGDGTVDLSEGSDFDSRHIDWILWQDGQGEVGTSLTPISCRVVTDSMPNGRYASDHFPVSSTFLVKVGDDQPFAERSRL